MGMALSVVQELLGDKAAFTPRGQFVDRVDGSNACGGMVITIRGTGLGSRRDNALIAGDYDVDLVAFITPSFDFGSLWRQAAETIEPMGVRMFCHERDFKYRICPPQPLAYGDWRERYQGARVANPGTTRAGLAKIASESRQRGKPVEAPSGSNCLDSEVYIVKPGHT